MGFRLPNIRKKVGYFIAIGRINTLAVSLMSVSTSNFFVNESLIRRV